MSKLIAFYAAMGLVLFGALFAVFAMAGIGRPVVPDSETAAESADAEPADAEPAALARSPLDFVPPDLEAGRVYRISHETPIYSAPDAATAQREVLPAGGYFTAVYTLTDVAGPWTQITVNNGFRDYSMYLLGADLRWKVLTPIYSEDEQQDQQMAAVMEMLKEASARRAQRQDAEMEEEPEVLEPPTFAEWWAVRAERMGGARVANMVVAGGASAVLTITIIGAIVLLTMLRREHEWSRPVAPHDDDTIDLQPEDDDPFTYSTGGSAYASHDDEDPRRA